MRPVVIKQTGVGISAWVPLDKNLIDFLIGLAAVVSGSATYTIEHTYDDIFDSTVTPTAWPHGVSNLVNATTSQEGNFVIPVRAVRINQSAGSGNVTLTVVQGGGK